MLPATSEAHLYGFLNSLMVAVWRGRSVDAWNHFLELSFRCSMVWSQCRCLESFFRVKFTFSIRLKYVVFSSMYVFAAFIFSSIANTHTHVFNL